MGSNENLIIEFVRQLGADIDDASRDRANEELNKAPLAKFTQDEFIEFMQVAADAAWDIPSALGMICEDEGNDITVMNSPMHRDTKDYIPNIDYWGPIDQHFLEEHHINLADTRINWSFST